MRVRKREGKWAEGGVVREQRGQGEGSDVEVTVPGCSVSAIKGSGPTVDTHLVRRHM